MNTSRQRAFRAASHFGLGPKNLSELDAIASDPMAWLEQQLQTQQVLPRELESIQSSAHYLAEVRNAMSERRSRKKNNRKNNRKNRRADPQSDDMSSQKALKSTAQEHFALRLQAALHSKQPFRERLVQFWSNHFTISSVGKKQLAIAAVPFENETMRRHLNGSFKDLLIAVEQHPVMLVYLDNVRSIGPDSRIGQRRKRGLNENLAREILELRPVG